MRLALVLMIGVCLVYAHSAKALRRPIPAHRIVIWICPDRPDGSQVGDKRVCIPEVIRR